jgi:hypothetical protein
MPVKALNEVRAYHRRRGPVIAARTFSGLVVLAGEEIVALAGAQQPAIVNSSF